ncbi:DEAD/DEAH box helicase [Protaetiibacter larvae]|uniref:DEAD/DEAH box helicase n=1 Tax=Protaetiibacter larvae TaxID=2592654 RepID=UPI003CCC4AA1
MPSLDLVSALPRPWDPDEFLLGFDAWSRSRGLPLYPAQEEAVLELVLDRHLVLSTPTGTGKSLVAVAAHAIALAQGRRSYYTAPLKALVSEKFFDLVHLFGAENVGMVTGDSSVNPDAPIVCCTAEILANIALRQGEAAAVDSVVMDEFHFYADAERGWAWQVPLLMLPRARFVLMSATLGDVSAISADLERRSGREVARVTGVERPVLLHYRYAVATVQETVEELLAAGLAPVYIVHFSQAAAVERAQALASIRVASREQRDAIAEAIGAFRFSTGFGQTLSRLVRAGIGVHHAGMLPRYRRLVEQLAQQGLLRVICGTDTLGVGINVPIRTVLLTGLTKFDGARMRQLTAREFHQVAGRAGRAGFDTAGEVVALAPEHEVDNARAAAKAGDDPKAKRRIVKKRAPDGFVNWGPASFERLIAAEPEMLTSSLRVTAAMLLQLSSRPGADAPAEEAGSAFRLVRSLVQDNHESPARRAALTRRAIALYRTLRVAGVLEQHGGGFDGTARVRVTVELQQDFALNQPLSPFALAALELLDRDADGYALDAVSVIEATLDDPRAILAQQEFRARGEAVAAMKAEGIEYEERMELLEEVGWPKPLEALLTQQYEVFASSQPWIRDFELRPKSVVRDLFERAMTFAEYVSFYQLGRSEGLVLRYLSDAYRAARQTIPDEAKTEELRDLLEWLGELVRQVDSSLLDEWSALTADGVVGAAQVSGAPTETAVAPPPDVVANRRAFVVLVRNALWRRVQLAALQRDDELVALDPDAGWPDALDAYFDEHDEIRTGPDARSAARIAIREHPDRWEVRQVIDDPAGDHDWGIDAVVDLAASREDGAAVLRVAGLTRL